MTAAVMDAPPIRIDRPGVFDIPADAYLADPVPDGSLSSSGARLLLPPSCPAVFKYRQAHPKVSDAFDFGRAAHKLVLGVGADIAVVDAPSWRTNAAKDAKEAAHEEGRVPLLRKDFTDAEAMAAAVRAHPVASALLSLDRGRPEMSLFWVDEKTSVWCRARPDWMPYTGPEFGARVIVADYKTTARSADAAEFAREAVDYGYHQQAEWYLSGIRALGLASDPVFLFVVQEKTPPFLVNVVQLDQIFMRIGRKLNRQALSTYAECVRDDKWPGYSDDVEVAAPPVWYERKFEGEF